MINQCDKYVQRRERNSCTERIYIRNALAHIKKTQYNSHLTCSPIGFKPLCTCQFKGINILINKSNVQKNNNSRSRKKVVDELHRKNPDVSL